MSARAGKIKPAQSWSAWGARPVSERRARAGKGPTGGRCVGRNTGDSDVPNVRSQCVAKDIAFSKDDSLFAATPPLEALR
eukprot:15170965-Alexandrium_andersonii.AAC.1